MTQKSKQINLEFWAGQAFTIFATIIGVYLAANSGFEKAIEFENVAHSRDAYYIQSAMLDELKHNVDKTKKWTTQFNDSPEKNDMHLNAHEYVYSYFLWEAMQESSAVFEVPYSFVGSIKDFYAQSETLKAKMLSGNPFEAPKAAIELQKIAINMEKITVDEFSEHLAKLRKSLIALNVKLDK